jgi:FtsP/CotA-like multicopper oxidase with cupredoxin domain
MTHSRRQLFRLGGATMFSFTWPFTLPGVIDQAPICRAPRYAANTTTAAIPAKGADYRIDIGTSVLELGKDTAISTKAYNGQFPGPLLRLTEGKRVTVDINNNTDTPEQLHWHGQFIGPDVDGAAEEGTPFIPAHGTRRVSFVPRPSGFRFYHTHMTAGADLSLGLYNGQAGLVYIEPAHDAGAYDREIFLTLKEFGPYLNHMEMISGFLDPKDKVRELFDIDQVAIKAARARGIEPGYQIGYNYFTVNGRMLGQGEPIRVKAGERVLFHILNASASELRSLALPGHVFKVVALDGNAVPVPAEVPVLWLGTAERISAIVVMNTPGVWTLGDLDKDAREHGMGIVVEYADRTGKPQWDTPKPSSWDYRRFAKPGAVAQTPDETIELLFSTQYSVRDGFDAFLINGTAFSMEKMEPRFRISYGRRYRLKMRNATDDVHPIHLHRHSFEITSIAGMPTAGVLKDVAMIGGFQEMTVDFTADQRGLSLFHCHMQDHMDFGFMALFDCA